jgi:Leucine-rich repeat (LRR) protein
MSSFYETMTDLCELKTLRRWLSEECDINYTLEKLSNLQGLNLSDNKLTYLPPEIRLLTNLRYLNLYNNNFTSKYKDVLQRG